MTLPPCEHRGRLVGQHCFCRHPCVAGPTAKPVPASSCNNCTLIELQLDDCTPTKQRGWKLGDQISTALSLIGVTEDRVTAWVGAPCGCSERKEKLNQLSGWAQAAVKSTAEKAAEKLARLLG